MIDYLLIVRLDEINTKGRNRHRFEKRLVQNLAHALGVPITQIQREQGQFYVHLTSADDSWVQNLKRVFGVKNFSPAVQLPPTIQNMEMQAITLARQEVSNGASTFKVQARRAMKSFPVNSTEINARLGELIRQSIPELSVDVHEPDFRLRVDVREVGILMSTRTHLGPGGLPVGINGQALLLLSGGIDSPVAGWMAMKRGLAIDAVYFHSPPYTSEKAKEKVLELARVLSRWKTAPIKVYVVPLTEIQTETANLIQSKFWTLIHRRFMHRLAERIGHSDGYEALVTGESLGQVASQTVGNIGCIDRAVDTLILRPLIGFDKREIISQAKEIGTYEISIWPYEDCCTLFAPKDPALNANVERLETVEARLEIEGLLDRALERVEVFVIRDS